jgi:hypothetical protein
MNLPTISQTLSHALILDEVLARLAASPIVDGLALFGSRPAGVADPASDYDLLLLVHSQPVQIFQLLTSIDGRLADVVLVETALADRALAPSAAPVAPFSFESMYLLKMGHAEIVYDASGRLHQARQKVTTRPRAAWLQGSSHAAVYAAWFWQNHTLVHLQRIVNAQDEAHRTEFDLMLAAALGDLGRAYYTLRDLPWEGQKTAVRYWERHDPDFLAQLRACLGTAGRQEKLAGYRLLVAQALAPAGGLWPPGVTAVYLADPAQHETHAATALSYWNELLGSKPDRRNSANT